MLAVSCPVSISSNLRHATGREPYTAVRRIRIDTALRVIEDHIFDARHRARVRECGDIAVRRVTATPVRAGQRPILLKDRARPDSEQYTQQRRRHDDDDDADVLRAPCVAPVRDLIDVGHAGTADRLLEEEEFADRQRHPPCICEAMSARSGDEHKHRRQTGRCISRSSMMVVPSSSCAASSRQMNQTNRTVAATSQNSNRTNRPILWHAAKHRCNGSDTHAEESRGPSGRTLL